MIVDFNLERCTNLTRPNTPMLITSYSEKYGDNVAPMSAFGFLSYKPTLSLLPVHPSRKTYSYIRETGECVMNVPSAGILNKVFLTGKKVTAGFDKFKEYGLTKEKSQKVKPVRIKECIAWIEFKVIEELFPKESERSIFILKPVSASVRSEVIQGECFNPEKAKIPVHLSGNVFSVAEKTVLVHKDKIMTWEEYCDYIQNGNCNQSVTE